MSEIRANGVNHRDSEQKLLALLDTFGKLEKGWNGYSALAPTILAIENAKSLVRESVAADTLPERVEPSAMGGVGITFTFDNRDVVVELYNSGTAHALFVDNQTEEMETRPVTPQAEGYRAFLHEVRKYLNVLETTGSIPRSNVS